MLCVLYCMYVPRRLQLELSFNSCFALLFASAEKYELAKREKACMKRLRNTVGIYVIYDSHRLIEPLNQGTIERKKWNRQN